MGEETGSLLDVVLAQLGTDRLTLDQLVDRLITSGTVEDDDDEVDELLYDLEELLDGSDAIMDVPGTVLLAATQPVIDSRVLTHRLTPEEVEATNLEWGTDLSVLDLGLDSRALAWVDGTPVAASYDRDLMRLTYELPPELNGQVVPGQLLAVRRVGSRLAATAIADVELTSGAVETAALLTQIEAQRVPGAGVEILPVVLGAWLDDANSFTSPVLPLTELLERAGQRWLRDFVGPADEPWEPPGRLAHLRLREQLVEQYELNPCCAEAFDLVEYAWRAHILPSLPHASGDDRPVPTAREAARALNHGAVAGAFADELRWFGTIGAERSHALETFLDRLIGAGGKDIVGSLYVAGQAAEAAATPADAEHHYRRALHLQPSHPQLAQALGEIAFDRGEVAQAVALLRTAGLKQEAAAMEHFAPASGASVGRNDPCPCGSGRKSKACHQGRPVATAAAGEQLLLARLRRHVVRGHGNAILAQTLSEALLDEAADADDPSLVQLAQRLATNPTVVDLTVFEGGGAEDYLWFRGQLLNDDELALIARWQAVPLCLYEVLGIEPGRSLRLRDAANGDEVTLREAIGPHEVSPGDRLLARVDSRSRMVGNPLRVPPGSEDELLDLLADDVTAADLVQWYLGAAALAQIARPAQDQPALTIDLTSDPYPATTRAHGRG